MSSAGYPIRTVLPCLWAMSQGFFQNIVMFMPFGFLLPLLNSKIYSVKKVVLLAFYMSLGIEFIQLVSMVTSMSIARMFDVEDLIANTLGGGIGFFIYKLVVRINIKKVEG